MLIGVRFEIDVGAMLVLAAVFACTETGVMWGKGSQEGRDIEVKNAAVVVKGKRRMGGVVVGAVTTVLARVLFPLPPSELLPVSRVLLGQSGRRKNQELLGRVRWGGLKGVVEIEAGAEQRLLD